MRPKPPAPRIPSGRLAPAYAVLAVFFALVQMRMFAILLPNAMLHSAQVTEGLVHGEAAWRVFQSRILTPYLLQGLSAVTGSYLSAYDLFAVVTIAAGAWWTAALSQRLEDPRRPAMAAFLLHQMALSLLIITNWLYPWDLLSIPLFATFHYLVERRAGKRAFAALFGVSIVNSEMDLFMAGWLVVDPILRYLLALRGSAAATRLDWGTVGL